MRKQQATYKKQYMGIEINAVFYFTLFAMILFVACLAITPFISNADLMWTIGLVGCLAGYSLFHGILNVFKVSLVK